MVTQTEPNIFQLAYDLVCHTGRNVFLTGKAGTGKTTFLKQLVANCDKRLVVVAPTGVAAINAGGVTLHSQFNLPLEPTHFLNPDAGSQIFNSRFLFRNVRLSSQKIQVLRQLELLIIDEVSMVRADLLDLVDLVLRHYRNCYHLPFGGVQVLLIGDLFQLSPVLRPEEWERMKVHYTGHFFFHSRVVQEADPVHIELTKVFRQKEQQFVDLLNQVRKGELTDEVIQRLNSRWDPDFQGPENGYVTLCTHNRMADTINQAQLEKLESPLFRYFGEVSGDFNEKALPAEEVLELKMGARVMFIRNDSSEDKRYYNGKQGIVTYLDEYEIMVDCGQGSFAVGREIWENVQFSFNKEKDKIEEEVLGSFSQYPLRLAWAITIHKSQGLTFEKVVVDAGQSFSPGQVYVALSRCTSLDGLVLKSRIPTSAIFTDGQILNFTAQVHTEEVVQHVLEKEKSAYMATRMLSAYSMEPIKNHILQLEELIPSKRIPHPEVLNQGLSKMKKSAENLSEVCDKSRKRFSALISDPEIGPDSDLFKSKMKAGIEYFSQKFQEEFLDVCLLIFKDLKAQKGVKGLINELFDFKKTIENQRNRIHKMNMGGEYYFQPPKIEAKIQKATDEFRLKKAEKGETYKITLELFREGKTIDQIAQIRGLSTGTIEGHLARYVESGEVNLEQILTNEKIALIENLLEGNHEVPTSGELKSALGEAASWGEIRLVLAKWNRSKKLEIS